MIAMPTEDVREVLIAADPDRHIAGMQLVQRRWNNKDGLIIRLARIEEPPAELTQQLIDAVYKARPLYPDEVREGRAHPLEIEWVSRSELVTNPLTGKLKQVVDERPHAPEPREPQE
jgi:phenylacetate-CoA ligase